MFGYVTQLRTITRSCYQHPGVLTLRPTPTNIAEEVVAKSKGKAAAE